MRTTVRALALLALIFAGCATPAARTGGSYVAGGAHHVVTTHVVARASGASIDEAALDETLQALRNAPGNLAVMLLRRNGELTIVAEWRSLDDARRAGGELFEVLFEAAEFEAVDDESDVPNSGSASSPHSGASSQNHRSAP